MRILLLGRSCWKFMDAMWWRLAFCAMVAVVRRLALGRRANGVAPTEVIRIQTRNPPLIPSVGPARRSVDVEISRADVDSQHPIMRKR